MRRRRSVDAKGMLGVLADCSFRPFESLIVNAASSVRCLGNGIASILCSGKPSLSRMRLLCNWMELDLDGVRKHITENVQSIARRRTNAEQEQETLSRNKALSRGRVYRVDAHQLNTLAIVVVEKNEFPRIEHVCAPI